MTAEPTPQKPDWLTGAKPQPVVVRPPVPSPNADLYGAWASTTWLTCPRCGQQVLVGEKRAHINRHIYGWQWPHPQPWWDHHRIIC